MRDPEVGDLGLAVGGEENIGRLDIAVDNPPNMRVVKSAGDQITDMRHLFPGESDSFF